jgi:hypothetical protein
MGNSADRGELPRDTSGIIVARDTQGQNGNRGSGARGTVRGLEVGERAASTEQEQAKDSGTKDLK